MKSTTTYLFLFFILMLTQACNTLYSTKTLNIEVLEPGKVKLPDGYSKLALRYNNTNISYNPIYAAYFIKGEKLLDTSNIDSIASWIYYDYVVTSLRQQDFLDTVIELKPADYSAIQVNDSLPMPVEMQLDSLSNENEETGKITAYTLSRFLRYNPPAKKESAILKNLDPEFALYTKKEISDIADSTNADLLLSLDHFVTQNAVETLLDQSMIEEIVTVNAFWTVFDLKEMKLIRYFQKNDTIIWNSYYSPGIPPFKMVPPRRDAVLNASDMVGTSFAEYLSPHWINVERFYYISGHVELKKTDQLIKDGDWLGAAKIWKSEVDNQNKSISAKCMFNLAVANEMQGDLDSALDWAVRSYHIFGERNLVHAQNCRAYIQVLAQRRVDTNVLDTYFFPE